MSECNAIIEANNEINRLKRENKKLNALCVQYGFDMGSLDEENEQLKETIKELELENAKHIGDGEWDIRDITYSHGKFRLEEWGERYHQFYNGEEQLEDEEVVSLLFENEKLKGEVKRLKCINKQLEDRLDHSQSKNRHAVAWTAQR